MPRLYPGCRERKCPCRSWYQCHQYVDQTDQLDRLKRKEYKKSIKQFYDNTFKLDISMPDMVVNS